MIWLSAFLFSQEGLTHIHKRPYLTIRTQGFNFKYKILSTLVYVRLDLFSLQRCVTTLKTAV